MLVQYKFRPSMESKTNVVCKIPCANCSWCYIGETVRAGNTRKKKKHMRNIRTAAKGSTIANHAWANNTSLILKTGKLLTKALSEPEKH